MGKCFTEYEKEEMEFERRGRALFALPISESTAVTKKSAKAFGVAQLQRPRQGREGHWL